MTWTLSDSLEDFRAAAGEFLAAHPAENTVPLTIVDRLSSGAPTGGDPAAAPRFGWWRPAEGEPVGAAFLQTPPQPIRLSRMPHQAAAELAETLAGTPTEAELPGVGGAVEPVEAFGAAWAQRSGRTLRVRESLRLYRLGELAAPAVDGRLRPARPGDRALLGDWLRAFVEEAGVHPGNVEQIVERRTEAGLLHVWEAGGRAVSMAGSTPVLAGMVRIGPVYTPPEVRGRGFGSAVTAGVSAVALERGAAQVLLFTDLANPTSNSIYQRIGYRKVEDNLLLESAN